MARRQRNSKNPWSQHGSFAGIPRMVMASENFISLTSSERALLLEAANQFNGSNNGNLSFEFSKMKNRGFRSKSSLEKSRKALVDKGFLVVTRVGFAGIQGLRQPTLYALTYYQIDQFETPLLDVKPTRKPIRGPVHWKTPAPK